MSKRKQRTLDELKDISAHLAYEIQMLHWDAIRLLAPIDATNVEEAFMSNARLESFALHARNVMDFFYPDKPRPNDAIAEDFFDDPSQWRQRLPAISALLEKTRIRVNKQVAHLTYDRLGTFPAWPYVEIANELLKVVQLFCHEVPSDGTGPHFNDAILSSTTHEQSETAKKTTPPVAS